MSASSANAASLPSTSSPAPAPDVVGGQLDASLLRAYISRSLTDRLDALPGPKILIIDASIAGPLGLVTEVGDLKNHGVDKLFWLEPGPLGSAGSAVRNIVWVVRPNVKVMKLIAEQVLAMPPGSAHTYTLLMAPRVSPLCTAALSDAGVLGSLSVHDFPLGLIPLENDLLSLEDDFGSFGRLFSEGDFTPVYDMAVGLMTLQRAYGLIPRIIGKGESAKRLTDVLKRLRHEQNARLEQGVLDSLIVFDRTVDLVTPLCTQLTYEGLLDEVIGIKNAHVEVAPDLLAPSTPVAGNTAHSIPSSSTAASFPQNRRKKHPLSSADGLFAELRDKNFALVGATLNRVAKRISTDYEKRNEAKTPKQIRDFVSRLGGLQNEHQALRLHTGLSEQIMQTTSSDEFNIALEIQQNLVAGLDLPIQENGIRNLINQETPLRTVLRLLCLYSIVAGGIKPKVLEEFKRDILQTYGYNHLNLLLALSGLNLLSKPLSTKPPFTNARKSLKLIVDDVDEADPHDVAYVFSGYAPLSVRIVQCALGGKGGEVTGWRGSAEDVLRSLPGVTFEETQKIDDPRASRYGGSGQLRTTVVCFLGGATYAEVAALRFAASQFKDRRIVIATTGMLTGNTLITSLMPPTLRPPQ